MASCPSVKAVERRKGIWWSREDSLLIISQYGEHEQLNRNVNCEKKSIWEQITASMAAENQTSAHDLIRGPFLESPGNFSDP